MIRRLLHATFVALLFGSAAAAQSATSTCPTVTVVGPNGITYGGDSLTFSANLTPAGTAATVNYKWGVSIGTISSGQGTEQITVQTYEKYAYDTVATVEIEGLPEGCPNIFSESAMVYPRPACTFPFDEYSRASWADERARLDNLALVLRANGPEARGVISIYLGEGETVADARKHVTKMMKHLGRLLPPGGPVQIVFTIQTGDLGHLTQYRVYPQGAEIPRCEGCTVIKFR